MKEKSPIIKYSLSKTKQKILEEDTVTFDRKGSFSEIFKHFSKYFTGDLAVKSIGFISIPVLTRILTPSDYGSLNVFNTYVSIFTILFSINLFKSIARYYFEDRQDYDKFLGGILLVCIGSNIVLWGITFASSIKFNFLSGLSIQLWILLIPLLISGTIANTFRGICIVEKKSGILSKINLIQSISILTVAVAIILSLDESKYIGYIFSMVIVGVVLTTFRLKFILKRASLTLNKNHIVYAAKFSVPLLPYSLSGILLAQFDRLFIYSNVGSYEAGIYSFAYNIGLLLNVFHSAIISAFTPFFFEDIKKNNIKRLEDNINKILIMIFIFGLGLILFGKELGMLLANANYYEGLDLIPPIVIGYVFLALYYVYGRNFGYTKKTYFTSLTLIFGAVINIVLNKLYIPIYGYQAAAYTTLISYLITFVIAYLINKVFIKVYIFPIAKVIEKLFWLMIFVGAFIAIKNIFSFWILIFIKVGLLLIFGLIMISSVIDITNKRSN